MSFAAPRPWRMPGPGVRTDSWVTLGVDAPDLAAQPQGHYSIADAAAVADMERQLHALRVEELATQRRAQSWRPRTPHPADVLTSAPEPWRELAAPQAPPPLRRREKQGWNLSTHTRSKSFPSQVADADTTDRLRKEQFQLRREPPLLAREELRYRQQDRDHVLSRPVPNRGARHTRAPRRQRRWSDPQIKVFPATMHDAQHAAATAATVDRRQRGRAATQARDWEQRAGEGRGLAGREMLGEWRTVRSKEERLRAVADAAGAAAALEHGLHGAFGGYEHHCLNDAGAMHMLREKLAREKTRALELEAQLWEERHREWELEKALEHSVHAACQRVHNGGWGPRPQLTSSYCY